MDNNNSNFTSLFFLKFKICLKVHDPNILWAKIKWPICKKQQQKKEHLIYTTLTKGYPWMLVRSCKLDILPLIQEASSVLGWEAKRLQELYQVQLPMTNLATASSKLLYCLVLNFMRLFLLAVRSFIRARKMLFLGKVEWIIFLQMLFLSSVLCSQAPEPTLHFSMAS